MASRTVGLLKVELNDLLVRGAVDDLRVGGVRAAHLQTASNGLGLEGDKGGKGGRRKAIVQRVELT